MRPSVAGIPRPNCVYFEKLKGRKGSGVIFASPRSPVARVKRRVWSRALCHVYNGHSYAPPSAAVTPSRLFGKNEGEKRRGGVTTK